MTKQQALEKIEELKGSLDSEKMTHTIGELTHAIADLILLDKQEDKKEWPNDEESIYYLNDEHGIASTTWDALTYQRKKLEDGLYFRTKEDAEAIRDWIKAQRLTWMPDGDNWFTVRDGSVTEQSDSVYEQVSAIEFATGNVHKTKADAEEYAKIMARAAEVKKKL